MFFLFFIFLCLKCRVIFWKCIFSNVSFLIYSQGSVDHTDPVVLDQHYYLYMLLGTVVVHISGGFSTRFYQVAQYKPGFLFREFSLSVSCVEETTYQWTCLQNATMPTFCASNKKCKKHDL